MPDKKNQKSDEADGQPSSADPIEIEKIDDNTLESFSVDDGWLVASNISAVSTSSSVGGLASAGCNAPCAGTGPSASSCNSSTPCSCGGGSPGGSGASPKSGF